MSWPNTFATSYDDNNGIQTVLLTKQAEIIVTDGTSNLVDKKVPLAQVLGQDNTADITIP